MNCDERRRCRLHLHHLPARRMSLALAITCWILTAAGASAFGAYSESTLERLAQASSLSYIAMDRMASSPYYEACRLEPVAQVVDPQSESGATIFRARVSSSSSSSDDGDERRAADDGDGGGGRNHRPLLVVACRGSANPKNFGTNLKFELVPATRLSQNSIPDGALVHDGFQTASVGLWTALSRPLTEQLRLLDPSSLASSDIVFTGHSLGAATALLTATHYKASFDGPSPSVITFGGPKLCNSVLARHLRNEALEGSAILHLVHSKDPVLANNQKLWDSLGFESVGIEMECDPHSARVFGAAAGEDAPDKKSSLFGNFAWNIVDHCKYMGVFVGPRALF